MVVSSARCSTSAVRTPINCWRAGEMNTVEPEACVGCSPAGCAWPSIPGMPFVPGPAAFSPPAPGAAAPSLVVAEWPPACSPGTPAGVPGEHAGGHSATTSEGAAAPGAGGENAAGPGTKGMPGMEGQAQPAGEQPTQASGSTVFISPARQQLIGVRTALVEHRALDTTIRAVGTLAYDETRVTQVNTKVAGWIERVYVDYVGKPVRRGEPLFSVYSPDLVATQSEYLLALKARDQFASSQVPETRASSESLLAATRQRLTLWDISDAQICLLYTSDAADE